MSEQHANGRIRPVILAGGAGTRLWPLSTPERPKHLLPLIGETSLFEQTLARFGDAEWFAPPIVVANEAQGDEIESLLSGTAGSLLVLEPMKRDSAPAIALAALLADRDELLLVTPSDHHIADLAAFHAAIVAGRGTADGGDIVTFGIEPDYPATGYGYIAAGEGEGVRRVERFVEKPDEERARAMIDVGGHYWNAGIFLGRSDTWLRAMRQHVPTMVEAAEKALASGDRDGSVIRPAREEFARSPAQSIDYAVMEKESAISVVPVAMGWSDIGSWDALFNASGKDATGNVLGTGTVAIDGHANLIRTSGPRVAALGVDDLVIVATPDAVLVTRLSSAQRVREAAAWFDEESRK